MLELMTKTKGSRNWLRCGVHGGLPEGVGNGWMSSPDPSQPPHRRGIAFPCGRGSSPGKCHRAQLHMQPQPGEGELSSLALSFTAIRPDFSVAVCSFLVLLPISLCHSCSAWLFSLGANRFKEMDVVLQIFQ